MMDIEVKVVDFKKVQHEPSESLSNFVDLFGSHKFSDVSSDLALDYLQYLHTFLYLSMPYS